MTEITNSDGQISSTAPVAQAPVEAPVAAPAPAPVAQPAPAAISDRTTEQFNKILESNKRLFEANQTLAQELASRAAAAQTFAPINQPPVIQPQPQQTVNPQDFVEQDPITGERYVNEAKLQSKIAEMERRTSQAQEAISRYIQTAEQRELDRQSKETYQVYPELDPNNFEKHDINFHKATRSILYDSLLNPKDYGGKPLTFKEAADYVVSSMGRKTVSEPAPASFVAPAPTLAPTPAPTQSAEGQAMLDQAQAIKEQAAANAQGQAQPTRETAYNDADRNRLVMETREGKLDALARRLTMTDHTFKDQMATQ